MTRLIKHEFNSYMIFMNMLLTIQQLMFFVMLLALLLAAALLVTLIETAVSFFLIKRLCKIKGKISFIKLWLIFIAVNVALYFVAPMTAPLVFLVTHNYSIQTQNMINVIALLPFYVGLHFGGLYLYLQDKTKKPIKTCVIVSIIASLIMACLYYVLIPYVTL